MDRVYSFYYAFLPFRHTPFLLIRFFMISRRGGKHNYFWSEKCRGGTPKDASVLFDSHVFCVKFLRSLRSENKKLSAIADNRLGGNAHFRECKARPEAHKNGLGLGVKRVRQAHIFIGAF